MVVTKSEKQGGAIIFENSNEGLVSVLYPEVKTILQDSYTTCCLKADRARKVQTLFIRKGNNRHGGAFKKGQV